MGNTFFFEWEVHLMEWIQGWMGPFGVALATTFTFFGEEMPMILVLGFLYWIYDKEYAKKVGDNLVIVNVFYPMIKNVTLRRRPYFDHPSITCLKPVDSSADLYDVAAQGYSFPSGHSMNSTVLYGSVARFRVAVSGKNRILIILAFVLPFLVGISRFMLGVHYPTDVLAGWALGVVILFAVPALKKLFLKESYYQRFVLAVGAIGFFYCNTEDYYTGYGIMLGFFLGTWLEAKKVHFENTRNIKIALLRLAGGLAIYPLLNTLMKLPFSDAFLVSGSSGALIFRTVRYAIIMFVLTGVYPMVFRKREEPKSKREANN